MTSDQNGLDGRVLVSVNWSLVTGYWSLFTSPPCGDGAIAQLGERVLCKHEVVGSIPSGSTNRSRAAGEGLRGQEVLRERRRMFD